MKAARIHGFGPPDVAERRVGAGESYRPSAPMTSQAFLSSTSSTGGFLLLPYIDRQNRSLQRFVPKRISMHLARHATIPFSLLLPMLTLLSAAQTSPRLGCG
jgi:hypothetical protein